MRISNHNLNISFFVSNEDHLTKLNEKFFYFTIASDWHTLVVVFDMHKEKKQIKQILKCKQQKIHYSLWDNEEQG